MNLFWQIVTHENQPLFNENWTIEPLSDIVSTSMNELISEFID